MQRIIPSLIILAAASSAAQAEVKSASPSQFEVESKVTVAATPAETYAMLGQVGEWWNEAHTYSGSASNLWLDLKAGGCFCERVPKDGGTIEHLRIVYARPGAALRAQGGLGPPRAEAVTGTLSWTLKPVPGGTEVTQTYAVSGHARPGLEKLAPLVTPCSPNSFQAYGNAFRAEEAPGSYW